MSKNTVKLECDICKKEFILFGVGIEVVRDDVWKHGFLCPHCKTEYIAYYTDENIRGLQKAKKYKKVKKAMETLRVVMENEKN